MTTPAFTSEQSTRIALAATLGAAVPLLLAELAALPPDARVRRLAEWAGDDAASLLACCGDILLHRQQRARRDGGHAASCLAWQAQYPEHTMRPGDCVCLLRTADLWVVCARAVAALAHLPGGVTFAGTHWEVP